MSANGKSLITKEERGFIKVVAEEESGVIVGAQMMCRDLLCKLHFTVWIPI